MSLASDVWHDVKMIAYDLWLMAKAMARRKR